MSELRDGTFRSLAGFNYRLWALGALVSNVGTWMQRTAQDWLVLTELTHHSATALGTVMALQFGPASLLVPFTGYAADRFNRRKLLLATQSLMALLALGLGLLTLLGWVRLWHVYAFALAQGCTAAFDAPARQTFVSELVPESRISNAVALNSSSFSAARMVGPALAGLLIGSVGSGWMFLINAASFVAVIGSLLLLRVSELHRREPLVQTKRGLAQGVSYVWQRRELRAVMTMVLLMATFGFNLPIFISTMSVRAFGRGPSEFGLLSSLLAAGTLMGALLSARRSRPRGALLVVGAALFGAGLALAAVMPSFLLFGLTLTGVGIAAQTFTTTANGTVQLATEPYMRGRVMAIFLAIQLGTTLVGAPLVGLVADHYGPRWALAVGALAGLLAALVGISQLQPESPKAGTVRGD
ncbi:MAG: MFS transporter [Myxococcales bacterium]